MTLILTLRDNEIEAAIARFWPDLDKVSRATGAAPHEVAHMVERLERRNIDGEPTRSVKPKPPPSRRFEVFKPARSVPSARTERRRAADEAKEAKRAEASRLAADRAARIEASRLATAKLAAERRAGAWARSRPTPADIAASRAEQALIDRLALERYDEWGRSRSDDKRIPRDENGTYRSYVLDVLCNASSPLGPLAIMRELNASAGPGDRIYTHSQVVGYLETLARKRLATWHPRGLWTVDADWWAERAAETERAPVGAL